MSKLSNLKHIDHGKYDINMIRYTNYNLKNPNTKKKEYIQDDSLAIENDKLAYIQLIYNNNPIIYVTTPKMFCPFGLSNKGYTMNLQFTNYKTDPHMNSFFEFVKNIEFQQMSHLGLDGSEGTDNYLSQIQYSKDDVYDPSMVVKLPFKYNKFEVDIYNDKFPMSILNIQKYMNMKCDIYIDKIWKFNDRFVCKWKVRNIYVY